MSNQPFKLNVLVDKEKNRILFAESDADFVDVLFSFMTIPLGTIIRLTRSELPPKAVGCMNNLYSSVENLDVAYLRTDACKSMLLHPRNAAASQCSDLKLKLDNAMVSSKLFYCGFRCRLLSHYIGLSCVCGREMNFIYASTKTSKNEVSDAHGGTFVKRRARFLISDALEVLPTSTATIISGLSRFGITDGSNIQESTFSIGYKEVMELLKSSLVSHNTLTETLLKQKDLPESSNETFCQGCSSVRHQIQEHDGNDKLYVRLVISKSKKRVCYAEVNEEFIDLLFSFLTLPLGFVIKHLQGLAASKGCINHLYNSIKVLDVEKYFKSNDFKEILLSPKIAPTFGYDKQLLRVDEAVHQYYCTPNSNEFTVTTEKSSSSGNCFTVKDPKSPYNSSESGGGYVMGPAMFTVTDDLNVTPISSVSVLSKLKVPFNDIEERVVHVTGEEACHLLVASFTSETALTDTFFYKNPIKQEY